MGWFSDFFGGGESEQVQEPRRVSTWDPKQLEMLRRLLGMAGDRMGTPSPTSPQPWVDRTPEEEQYFDWTSGLAKSRALTQMREGEVPYDVGPEHATKMFEEQIRPMWEQEHERYTVPGIQAGFAGPTYTGSARAEAIGRSGEDLATKMTGARAGLQYQEETARRTAIENAMGRVLPAEGFYGTAQGGAGQLARMIEGEKKMGMYQQFMRGEQIVDPDTGETYFDPLQGDAVRLAMALLGFDPYTIGQGGYGSQTGPGLGYGILEGFFSQFGKNIAPGG